MNNLETLKQELITQKEIIELKGGKVPVANNHPSPSEITTGINSIVANDLSMSTATEADVMFGKTFFSGDAELRTGTGLFDKDLMNHIFMADNKKQTTEDVLYYEFPSTCTSIRQYLFYNNVNNIRVTFNPELTAIKSYAFCGATNMVLENFDSLTNLTSISDSAFSSGPTKGYNNARLPNSIKKIESAAFYNVFSDECVDYKFPDSLTSVGSDIYRQMSRKYANSLDLSNYNYNALTYYCFEYIAFNCDLIIPSAVKTILPRFNHYGCFKNIVIPSSITSIGDYAFGSPDTDSASHYYLKTVTFESEKPPTLGTKVFALQNLEHDFKIYVPDTAIEEYKAVEKLSPYLNNIYPLSEKE